MGNSSFERNSIFWAIVAIARISLSLLTAPIRALVGLSLLCTLTLTLTGQTSASSGAIEGWVFDGSGGPLAGVRVVAKNQQTAATRAASTDEHGYFRDSDVPVGPYSLEITLDGFAPSEQKDITVHLGATIRVDAHLRLATQVQQITVTGQPPIINPSDTSMTSSVGRERIEESPVRTRNALDFVLLEPNVVRRPPPRTLRWSQQA
jgi:hypothetical protein